MKNVSRIFVVLATLMLLTACVNIPIGDGNKLKVGKEGVTFTDSEGEKQTYEFSDEEIKVTDEKGESRFELSEDGMTFTNDEGKNHTVTVDGDEDKIIMEGFDDEGGEVGFSVGENVELPKDLPDDIPMTKDAQVIMATNSNTEVIVNYVTEEPIDKLVLLYDTFYAENSFVEAPEMVEQNYEEVYSKTYQAVRSDGDITIQIMELKGEYERKQVSIYFYKNLE